MTRPRVASSSSSWPVCASLKRPTAAARCVVCVHKSFSFGSLDIVAPVHYCHCRAQVCVENNSVVLENYIYRWTYLHRGGIPSISMMLFYFEVDERVRLAMAVPTCGFWTTGVLHTFRLCRVLACCRTFARPTAVHRIRWRPRQLARTTSRRCWAWARSAR